MSRLRWPDSTNSVSDDPGTVQSGRGPVLYAAGHEHSLQVLKSDVVDYVLVSGAGSPSEVTAVTHGPDTIFAHEHAGFMSLDVTSTTIVLSVIEPDGSGGSRVMFSVDVPLTIR